ncbi:uncharacterized protein LOC107046388 [Diachasma alloeum]|uniref:uncharacterized protein LOC107046388 n=1 Tax=Diachasma alloeum TaxID=454923 RepID=UPI00073842C3|nr:uncharacterized protein LOC107046388 [Diachasma alloeum]
MAKVKNACFYCLKTNHSCKTCRYKEKCKLVNDSQEQTVRAIIDTGSHHSYILGQVAESLGYEIEESRTIVHSLFGGSQTQPQDHPPYRGRQPISLLIGADVVGRLYTGGLHNLDSGITAVETRLGWTLLGKASQPQSEEADPALLTVSMFVQEANVNQLWDLDVLGITDAVQKISKEAHQQQVLMKFHDITRINAQGRYEVLLPWKENHPSLPDNRFLAEKGLDPTWTRLKAKNMVSDYEKIFYEWLEEGIIERVPEDEVNNPGHYIPHRSVIKENSTTRIRPVFDASAKGKIGPLLNECLETGPNLIELILSLLMRFREKRIGVIADVRKAFLQISVDPEDRDFLRVLWRPTHNPDIREHYRHLRVVFGVSSYGKYRAMENTESQVEIITLEKLRGSFYVDNCVTSVHSPEKRHKFQKIATETLKTGGFDLRGWEHSGLEMPSTASSVLGLIWNRETDTLTLADTVIQKERPANITKRTVLSATQSLFDPLGMICPVLICPKVLLWAFGGGPEEALISLHAFVDASQEAYASVVYARVELGDKVECHFVIAKARVSPKDKPSIPRLELLAATVGARLMASVVSALNYTQRLGATFQGVLIQQTYHHGCTAKQLIESHWHEGAWLKLPPALWPNSTGEMDEAEVDRAVKKATNKKKTPDEGVVTCTAICHVLSNIQG